MRPKHLAMALSKLVPHPQTDVNLEQYATEGDLAAYWMMAVDQLDHVEGKTVADLGAGNGILGIACLLLGAERVVFVECHQATLEALRSNLASLDQDFQSKAEVVEARVGVDEVALDGVEVVVMNPPWGVQQGKADRPFLEAALGSEATAVHLLHSDHATHLEAFGHHLGWAVETVMRTEFRLPATYAHHQQRKGAADVQCLRFHREGDARLATEDDV
ncbi:MAG: hypothetical protein DWC10_04910 [Candidatus Poseidoniales archaeon]|nr:MAG: hypothetical protein DWC10_04910 [Candidatus Poseidoniales archaeon]